MRTLSNQKAIQVIPQYKDYLAQVLEARYAEINSIFDLVCTEFKKWDCRTRCKLAENIEEQLDKVRKMLHHEQPDAYTVAAISTSSRSCWCTSTPPMNLRTVRRYSCRGSA